MELKYVTPVYTVAEKRSVAKSGGYGKYGARRKAIR